MWSDSGRAIEVCGIITHPIFEGPLFDGRARLELTGDVSSQAQISMIRLGYPMGIRLDDQTVLTTHWCEEDGVCGIRWTRLRIAW